MSWTPRQRYNAGYWDGRNAHGRSRHLQGQGVADALAGKFHYDAIFAQGVRDGYDDTSGATTSDAAWKSRKSLRRQPA